MDAHRMLQDYYQESFGLATDPGPALLDAIGETRLLAKAHPDECFRGIGSTPTLPPCGDLGQEKTNEAYVWGMTKARNRIWFGTAPNVHCLVMGSYLGLTTPVETPSYVCEFGSSYLATSLGLPPAIGDFRPPKAYIYTLGAHDRKDRLREVQIPDPAARLAFARTLGIRSAGSMDGVVFLAGPSLEPVDSINVFAFDAVTTRFLGYRNLAEYSNVRKWRVVDGQLYVGVRNSASNPHPGGSVLRWVVEENDKWPFKFEVVGRLGSEVAELTVHEGRLFVTTWPNLGTGELASVYFSPVMPSGGLRALHQDGWTNFWQADMYECDPLCAATYGGGAIESFGDHVYWGTMHVPGMGLMAWASVFGMPTNALELAIVALGTYRNISIHRARFVGPNDGVMESECVYGMKMLPTFSPSTGWTLQPNNGGDPLMGISGFGNLFNNYTWTMAKYGGNLFVGTMDWSYLLLGDLLADVATPAEFDTLGSRQFGADLWYFPRPGLPALPYSDDGLGNPTNYGIRTMVSDRTGLYLGTANPMNLHERGGWELRRLRLPGDWRTDVLTRPVRDTRL